MTCLTPFTPEMYPELRAGLLQELNPHMPDLLWQQAFLHSHSDAPTAYTLTEGTKIVGILGTVFSDRMIHGQAERFCNLHTWIVEPEYRSRSLLLFKPLLALKDVTLTDFSPTKSVISISKRLGFTDLDRRACVMPVLPMSGKRKIGLELLDLVEPQGDAWNQLSQAEQKLFNDHQHLACKHLVIRDDEGYCYLVYSRITHCLMPRHAATCLVHHISDRSRFARYHAAIRSHLIRCTKSLCVVVDERFLAEVSIPNSFYVQATHKLYRPATVQPVDIDSLYSEQMYYNISTLPSLRSFVRSTLRRWTPQSLHSLVHATT